MSVDELASLTAIDANEVRILWINEWYGGLIEAVVEYQSAWHLMVVHEIVGDLPWRWVLSRLSPAQRAEEESWHRLFVEHVGAHWDCTGGPHPEPSGQCERVYQPYRTRAPRGDLDAVGWLTSMPEPKSPGAVFQNPHIDDIM